MKTNKKLYIQNKNDGSVYKVLSNHYLKLSPWKKDEDRRVTEINTADSIILSCENACMIVNKQFANTIEKWEHKGKKYIANATGNKDPKEHAYLLSTLPSHTLSNIPNDTTISLKSNNGLSELKLIKHKGKIYYILIINELLPRVKMYNLFGEFCQWANIKYCKPIFCETDKKYI